MEDKKMEDKKRQYDKAIIDLTASLNDFQFKFNKFDDNFNSLTENVKKLENILQEYPKGVMTRLVICEENIKNLVEKNKNTFSIISLIIAVISVLFSSTKFFIGK